MGNVYTNEFNGAVNLIVTNAPSFTFNDSGFNWAEGLMLYCDVHIFNGNGLNSELPLFSYSLCGDLNKGVLFLKNT